MHCSLKLCRNFFVFHRHRDFILRSNPFETIRGGFFLNRAAMKMANMDKVFDFMFSHPSKRLGC